MGTRTLQINRGTKFEDEQIAELHSSGEFYDLFSKYPAAIVASEFNSRDHISNGWSPFVEAVVKEIQDPTTGKLRVDKHGKTLVSKDVTAWRKAAGNARNRVLNCIVQSEVQQWTGTGKRDVNGIEEKSSFLGSGFNETWHNHAMSYVKGNNVRGEYGSSLVGEGTVVYN